MTNVVCDAVDVWVWTSVNTECIGVVTVVLKVPTGLESKSAASLEHPVISHLSGEMTLGRVGKVVPVTDGLEHV